MLDENNTIKTEFYKQTDEFCKNRENQYNHSIMQKILPILINERDLEDISAKMEVTYVPNDVGNN